MRRWILLVALGAGLVLALGSAAPAGAWNVWDMVDCVGDDVACVEYCLPYAEEQGQPHCEHLPVDKVHDQYDKVRDAVPDPSPVPEANAGGGAATGTVSFGGAGVPPAGAPCAAVSFTLAGQSQAFAVNTVIDGYAGPVTITGSGQSSCENATSGGGSLTLTASGTGPTGSTVQCTNLTGSYTRAGTDVTAVLGGTCLINGYPARTSFAFRGEFVPSGAGAGVTAPIREATFQGPFAVAPA